MTASDEKNTDLSMDALDALFQEAASAPDAKPDEAFMARVLADAFEQQPMPTVKVVAPSLWEHVTSMFGGWQGMGGLVAATCAGFWIGVSPPEGLPTQFNTLLNLETSVSQLDSENEYSALIGFGWDVEEG